MRFEPGPATEADAAEATAILNALHRTHMGDDAPEETEQDTLDAWRARDLGRDSLALRGEDGRLAAFGLLEMQGGVLDLDGFVARDRTGLGLGTALVEWAEREARDRGVPRLRSFHVDGDAAAERLFRERGFVYVRSFYRMFVDLLEAVPAPEWPAGFELSTVRPGGEREIYDLMEEAFAEHWGWVVLPFEEWLEQEQREQPDPEQWYLVRDRGEPAAAAVCAQRFGMGVVGTLGVRPAWRKRGLGRALLLHAFREFRDRGETRAGLGVDATNETGAVRLYESVGMQVKWRADVSELTLGG